MTGAGWYPDPQRPDRLRWWDGSSWTGDVRDPEMRDTDGPVGLAAASSTAATSTRPDGRPRRGAVVAAVAVVAVLLLLAGAVAVLSLSGPDAVVASSPPESLAPNRRRPENLGTSRGASDLEARAAKAGVPVLDVEGVVTHTHTLLQVSIYQPDETEEPVTVDAQVGIDQRNGRIAAVHTHDEKGIIHVESEQVGDTYTVGQFLTLWTGETEPSAICAVLAGAPCHLFVSVGPPTPVDRRVMEGYGEVPATPPVQAAGLDTELAQGAVVGVLLMLDGAPAGAGGTAGPGDGGGGGPEGPN